MSELGAPGNSANVDGWSTGGQIFLDFINLTRALTELANTDASAYDVERLQADVTSLAHRIGQMKCVTSQQRLAQAEMAKRVANVLKTLTSLKGGAVSARFDILYIPYRNHWGA